MNTSRPTTRTGTGPFAANPNLYQAMQTISFTVGKIYKATAHPCWSPMKVVRRTAKTVTLSDGWNEETRRIKVVDCVEVVTCGRYFGAPRYTAKDLLD